jgi:hypothetical protein
MSLELSGGRNRELCDFSIIFRARLFQDVTVIGLYYWPRLLCELLDAGPRLQKFVFLFVLSLSDCSVINPTRKQRIYVIIRVGLCVCLFVCAFVTLCISTVWEGMP